MILGKFIPYSMMRLTDKGFRTASPYKLIVGLRTADANSMPAEVLFNPRHSDNRSEQPGANARPTDGSDNNPPGRYVPVLRQ